MEFDVCFYRSYLEFVVTLKTPISEQVNCSYQSSNFTVGRSTHHASRSCITRYPKVCGWLPESFSSGRIKKCCTSGPKSLNQSRFSGSCREVGWMRMKPLKKQPGENWLKKQVADSPLGRAYGSGDTNTGGTVVQRISMSDSSSSTPITQR
jgi:hypothetical protein